MRLVSNWAYLLSPAALNGAIMALSHLKTGSPSRLMVLPKRAQPLHLNLNRLPHPQSVVDHLHHHPRVSTCCLPPGESLGAGFDLGSSGVDCLGQFGEWIVTAFGNLGIAPEGLWATVTALQLASYIFVIKKAERCHSCQSLRLSLRRETTDVPQS